LESLYDVLQDKKQDYHIMMLQATTDEEMAFCVDETNLADLEIEQCKNKPMKQDKKLNKHK
jgi:hypothetical protein